MLKNQEFMEGLRYVDIDYCKYGFNCRKRTRIWTNISVGNLDPYVRKTAVW